MRIAKRRRHTHAADGAVAVVVEDGGDGGTPTTSPRSVAYSTPLRMELERERERICTENVLLSNKHPETGSLSEGLGQGHSAKSELPEKRRLV